MKKKTTEELCRLIKDLENRTDLEWKIQRANEIVRQVYELAGFATEISAPSANVLSGIVRYDVSQNEAEEKQKEKREMAIRGRIFRDGPKKPRRNKLREEIEKTYLSLKNSRSSLTARNVWNSLPLNEIIQEFDKIIQDNDDFFDPGDYIIFWNNGLREKKTRYKTFQNILTHIKKKFHS
jgi:hypothetical protein